LESVIATFVFPAHQSANVDLLLRYLRWVELILEIVLVGYEACYERDQRIFSGLPIPDTFLTSWLAQFDWILDKAFDIVNLMTIFTGRLSEYALHEVIDWLHQRAGFALDVDLLAGIEEAERLIREAAQQWMNEYHRCLNVAIVQSKQSTLKDEESNEIVGIFVKPSDREIF
jgi:hypothetical protein